MRAKNTPVSIDLEKNVESDDLQSLENKTFVSSTEFDHPSSLPGKLKDKEESSTLSRIESAVYDPASKVPTNATRESGIIGIQRYGMMCINDRLGWRT
jgi:hypothetical protein